MGRLYHNEDYIRKYNYLWYQSLGLFQEDEEEEDIFADFLIIMRSEDLPGRVVTS